MWLLTSVDLQLLDCNAMRITKLAFAVFATIALSACATTTTKPTNTSGNQSLQSRD